MHLEAGGARLDLLGKRFRAGGAAFSRKDDIHGKGLEGLQHAADVPGTRRAVGGDRAGGRSEEHTSELQSLMRISYAVFCLKKKNIKICKTEKQIKTKKVES